MALLQTPLKNSDFYAPDFKMKNIDGRMVSLKDVQGEKGMLILFICNHCPYVKAVIDRLVSDCAELQKAGIGCAAIMPNDTESHPDDSFDNMQKFAKAHGFSFPYLIDETQDTARAYDAVCTPDIFGFNADGQLQYRGRVDSAANRPADKNTVREMRDAMLAIAKTGAGPAQQSPSMGCSIKWRE